MNFHIGIAPSEKDIGNIAPDNMLIAVGFGIAQVVKDGEIVFDEAWDEDNYHGLNEFEAMAKVDPDHDWRVVLDAPLKYFEYQRRADGKWVVIGVGRGFA